MGSESLHLSQFRVSTRFFRIFNSTYYVVSKNIASLTFVTFHCLTNFCPITKFLRHTYFGITIAIISIINNRKIEKKGI